MIPAVRGDAAHAVSISGRAQSDTSRDLAKRETGPFHSLMP